MVTVAQAYKKSQKKLNSLFFKGLFVFNIVRNVLKFKGH